MGKWLAKFLADTQGALPDIPDTLPSESGLSGLDLEVCADITPPESALDGPTAPLQLSWLVAWQRLAQLTHGLEKTDPRFDLTMTLLDQCDEAFLKGDWEGFERIVEGLKENILLPLKGSQF